MRCNVAGSAGQVQSWCLSTEHLSHRSSTIAPGGEREEGKGGKGGGGGRKGGEHGPSQASQEEVMCMRDVLPCAAQSHSLWLLFAVQTLPYSITKTEQDYN